MSGDVDLAACLELAGGVDPALSAGVMIRESLDASAPATALQLSPAAGLALRSRGAAGAPVVVGDYSAASPPVCLRLVRQGDQFTAYTIRRRRAVVRGRQRPPTRSQR